MNAKDLFAVLKQDLKLKPYLGIIENEPRYPVFYDEARKVLSLPPIINSEATKISKDTKNCFIEITATDHTRARTALAILVSHFSEYCEDKFTVEPVKVIQADGTEKITPELISNDFEVDLTYTNRLLGITIEPETVPDLLKKMGLQHLSTDGSNFKCRVPPTRSDILHACDVSEDLGIGYGFNSIPRVIPPTNTVGALLPLNKFSDLLRQELAQAGYTEILTSGLISRKEIFDYLRIPFEEHKAVHLANSKTKEYDFVRTTLIPGVLKTIHANKAERLPHKVFEVTDVCQIDDSTDTGARNERRMVALYSDDKKSGVELVHGLLDLVMKKFGVIPHPERGYSIKESDHPTYFPLRQCSVSLKGEEIGHFGILHPDVSKAYKINNPCSVLELKLEPLFKLFEEES